MTPRSPALAALAALLLALPLKAGAVMCLKPGSLGPDVPNCTPYQEGSAKTAVSDNLLALAGDAAAEDFNERLAEDEAGPLAASRSAAAARPRGAALKAAAQVAAAPDSLGQASLSRENGEYDKLAGSIARGAGSSAPAADLGKAAVSALSPVRGASGMAGAPAAAPAAASAARMGFSRGMSQGGQVSIGSLTDLDDPGRSSFDHAAAAPAAGAAPQKPQMVRDCSPLHPCSDAN